MLSQQKYVVKILTKISMNNVKLVKSLLLLIVNSLQVYVLINEEEKSYMSRVLYASRKFDDWDGEMVNIHMQLVLWLETRKNQVKSIEMGASNTEAQVSASISYNRWSHLVCGYDSWFLDNYIGLWDTILIEWSILE